MTEETRLIYSRLVEVMRLLASSSESQLKAFPAKSLVTDEMAILYDECFRSHYILLEQNQIGENASSLMTEINTLFEKISHMQEIWTNERLATQEDWARIRVLARQVLTLLGEEPQAPDLSWLDFVE